MSLTIVTSVSVEVSGEEAADGAGIEFSETNTAGVASGSQPQVLSSGANTITVATNATGVVILPASNNTTAITFKGVSGDTGVKLHNTKRSTFFFDSSVTTFVLNAGSAITIRLMWL